MPLPPEPQRGAGFPSTHATVMGAGLGFMWLQMPPGPAFGGIAAVTLGTGWARVYAGAHDPLDVLAGLWLGGAAGLSVGCGHRRGPTRRQEKPPPQPQASHGGRHSGQRRPAQLA